MPFVKDLLNYKSISFVGMEKNAGKTETLNYVISRLHCFNKTFSVTSIGIDGETVDQVTATSKPKVYLYPGNRFVTSEKLYKNRQIVSCVESLSRNASALGRLVSAKCLSFGNVMLSGPTSTTELKELIDKMGQKSDLCLIDGALSRKSFASPSITQAMVLSTGAVVSGNLEKICRKTKFVCQMTKLPTVSPLLKEKLEKLGRGVFAVETNKSTTEDLNIPSLLMIDKYRDRLWAKGKTLYISGMINDKLLENILQKKDVQDYTLITKDFTHIFSSEIVTERFLERGGKILCLYSTKVLAISVNPVSPLGFKVDNKALLDSLRSCVDIPVYNVRDVND